MASLLRYEPPAAVRPRADGCAYAQAVRGDSASPRGRRRAATQATPPPQEKGEAGRFLKFFRKKSSPEGLVAQQASGSNPDLLAGTPAGRKPPGRKFSSTLASLLGRRRRSAAAVDDISDADVDEEDTSVGYSSRVQSALSPGGRYHAHGYPHHDHDVALPHTSGHLTAHGEGDACRSRSTSEGSHNSHDFGGLPKVMSFESMRSDYSNDLAPRRARNPTGEIVHPSMILSDDERRRMREHIAQVGANATVPAAVKYRHFAKKHQLSLKPCGVACG